MSRSINISTICAVTALAALLSSETIFATDRILPTRVQPLNASELQKIYGDKTWKWETGGGRFNSKDRRFIASVSSKDGKSYGEGRWSVKNNGVMCISANWVVKNGKSPARTCFQHVRDRGTIYQRRLPGGDWYIFKTFKARAGDEYNKLITKDTVTASVDHLKTIFK